MNYEELTLAEIKEIAKQRGIKNISKLHKEELIALLNENQEQALEEQTQTTIPKVSDEDRYKLTTEGDEMAEGILEVLPDGYGFLRGSNYLSTPKDVYISPVQIKRFRLDTGDKIKGIIRTPKEGEKFPALIFVGEVNGEHPENAMRRKNFDDLIPIYPKERLRLETTTNEYTMRMVDLL